MRWRANPSPISLNTGVRVLNPAYPFIPYGEIQEVSIGMMISTFTCLFLALITAHFPANVCGDGEEDLEEGNSHFGYWEGEESIAHCKYLDFTFLPFYLLGTGDGGPGRGKLTLRLLGGGKSIAHCKSLDFTFLPFTFLPFEGEDGAVSRTDTETPGARASCDGLGAPSDS